MTCLIGRQMLCSWVSVQLFAIANVFKDLRGGSSFCNLVVKVLANAGASY